MLGAGGKVSNWSYVKFHIRELRGGKLNINLCSQVDLRLDTRKKGPDKVKAAYVIVNTSPTKFQLVCTNMGSSFTY